MAEDSPVKKKPVENAAKYEDLEGEYIACKQHIRSKEQALRILQEQLKKADLNSQRLKQEINQLRSQLSRTNPPTSPSFTGDSSGNKVSSTNHLLLNDDLVQEKERLIEQLEAAQGKILDLERVVAQMEDEKMELAEEKDHFSKRCDSLVDEKKLQPPTHSTLQRLMEENKQLKISLVESRAEKEHALSRVERYKKVLDRKKRVEAAEELQNSIGLDKKQDMLRRISELEVLANSLSQSVKEKSVMITHQKKANKMLAIRITELEHQVKALEVSSEMCGPGGEGGGGGRESDSSIKDDSPSCNSVDIKEVNIHSQEVSNNHT